MHWIGLVDRCKEKHTEDESGGSRSGAMCKALAAVQMSSKRAVEILHKLRKGSLHILRRACVIPDAERMKVRFQWKWLDMRGEQNGTTSTTGAACRLGVWLEFHFRIALTQGKY